MSSKKKESARIVRRPLITMACAAAAMLVFAVQGWGQSTFQASGRSAVFTLAPGATAGPDAVQRGIVSQQGKRSGVTIAFVKNGILVALPSLRRGPADIAVYDMTGRLAFRLRGFSGASLRLDPRRFAPGMYNVIVRMDGQKYSRRIAVSR
jgi:hypothetical protein